MSNTGKITRHTIEKSESPDFFFLGIVSAEPDYRLSVLINREMDFDLRKNNEEIIIQNGTGENSFSRFTSTSPSFSLISNKSGRTLLLPKLKNIDFLFTGCLIVSKKEAEELSVTLRKIPGITAVFIFNSREITDKNLSLLVL